MFHRYALFGFVCAGLILDLHPVAAESPCIECRKQTQIDVAKCQGALPPSVTPRDPRKPTDAEKAAAKKRADAQSVCTKKAQDGLAKCRPLCPAG